MFGGLAMLSLAPCSMHLSRRLRFSPSHSTTRGGCEGVSFIASISRKTASSFPFVFADRRSRRTTSAHLRTSDMRSNSFSLQARMRNPSLQVPDKQCRNSAGTERLGQVFRRILDRLVCSGTKTHGHTQEITCDSLVL